MSFCFLSLVMEVRLRKERRKEGREGGEGGKGQTSIAAVLRG